MSNILALTEFVSEAKNPFLEQVQEPTLCNWRQILPNLKPEHERMIIEFTRQIRSNFVRSLMSAIEIGRILTEAKSFFEAHYGESFWRLWIQQELHGWSEHFTFQTALNYMNAYALYLEQPSLVDLKLSLRVFYVLARRNVPPEAIEEVKQLAEANDGKVRVEEARSIIREHQKRSLQSEFSFSDDVWDIITELGVDTNQRELRRLQQLPKKRQLEVLEVIATNPKIKVREALSYLQQRELVSTPLLTPYTNDEEVLPFDVKQKAGKPWREMLRDLHETFDLIICEPPLSSDWLYNYGDLFAAFDYLLGEKGRLLILAGQQNAPYVGHFQMIHAPNLRCGWMFFLRARPGESKRVLGLNIAAAYIPIVMFYRPPFEGFVRLVSDMLSYELEARGVSNDRATPILEYQMEEDGHHMRLVRTDEKPKLDSMEDCIQYYTENMLLGKEKGKILYFAPVASKRIGEGFVNGIMQAAKTVGVESVTIYLGVE